VRRRIGREKSHGTTDLTRHGSFVEGESGRVQKVGFLKPKELSKMGREGNERGMGGGPGRGKGFAVKTERMDLGKCRRGEGKKKCGEDADLPLVGKNAINLLARASHGRVGDNALLMTGHGTGLGKQGGKISRQNLWPKKN